MKKDVKIIDYMMKEHGKILLGISNFQKSSGSNKEEIFKELKEALEKHFFAEEKAIMMLESRGKKYKEMEIILEQHEEINSLISDVEKAKVSGKEDKEILKKLIAVTKTHIILENKKFYPRLDKDLEGDEKEKVFEKLHSYIIGSIGV